MSFDDRLSDLVQTYPPNISCFPIGREWSPDIYTQNDCSITPNMVAFLNLTVKSYKPYLAAYCLNPPADDDCPFGFCPNPDIAGSLVRIANYVTGFCLAILIFYAPKRVKIAFWSQMLITYSLLITCGISLIQKNLTRFHSVVLISIVCSPVNVYFTGYSVRAFWSKHRLNAVLGKKHYLQRAIVFFSVGIWIAVLVYAYLPRHLTTFAQESCRGTTEAEELFLGAPFIYLVAFAVDGGVEALIIFLAVPILVVVAWVFAIIRRRREIWPANEPYKAKFGKVWRTIMTRYPFLRFWTVVAIPTVYWIGIIELGVLYQQDDALTLTFGQVFAIFTAVPPLIEVFHLAHDLWCWFMRLTWVKLIKRGSMWFINLPSIRAITGRSPAPEVSGQEEMGQPDAEPVDDKKGVIDNRASIVAQQPVLGKTETPEP